MNIFSLKKKQLFTENSSFKPSSNASSSPHTPNLSNYLSSREKELLKSDQVNNSINMIEKMKEPLNRSKNLSKTTSSEILNSTPGAPPLNFNSMNFLKNANKVTN